MAKQKTVVKTPTKNPDQFAPEIAINSPEDADAALESLGWYVQKMGAVQTEFAQLHNAIELKRPKKLALAIGELETTIPARCQALEAALLAWCKLHLKEHLKEDEKALKLTHGSLHVRKLELSIEPQEGLDDAKVLDRIEKLTTPAGKACGLLGAARKVCTVVFQAATKLLLGDLVKVTISLNREAMAAAYKAKQLDDKTLKSLGLVACDTRERFSVKAF